MATNSYFFLWVLKLFLKKKILIMNTKALLSVLIICSSLSLSAQEVTEGTYMTLYTYYNYNVKVNDGKIVIEPCQAYEHQNSIDKETYIFEKIEGGSGYGWNGSAQIPLAIESNMLKFQNPYNTSVPVPMMLIHKKNTLPAEGVLTYFDETQGGYSNARIRITDQERIKTGGCFIHSKKSNAYNADILGTFTDDYDASMKMELKEDYTGTYLGHSITWSIVSDYNGNIKKWEYPSGGYLIHIMMEFTGTYPNKVDPPSAGQPVAIIEGVKLSQDTGVVSVGRMNKN